MQRNYHRHERAYTYMQVRTRLHKSYWKFTTLSSLWGLSVCFCLCTIAKGTIEPSTVADWFYVTLSLISTVFYPCRRYFMTSLQRTSVNQFHSLTAAPCYSHTSKVASPIYKKSVKYTCAHTRTHMHKGKWQTIKKHEKQQENKLTNTLHPLPTRKDSSNQYRMSPKKLIWSVDLSCLDWLPPHFKDLQTGKFWQRSNSGLGLLKRLFGENKIREITQTG